MLTIRWKAVEALQPLLVVALRFTRQAAELRVPFERLALLIERQLAMLVQPLPGMMPLRRGLILRI